jgi:hypothetical protein
MSFIEAQVALPPNAVAGMKLKVTVSSVFGFICQGHNPFLLS